MRSSLPLLRRLTVFPPSATGLPRTHAYAHSRVHFLARLGLAFACLSLVLPPVSAVADDDAWPGFRGPHRSGLAANGDFPTHFGPKSNLVWRIPVPSGNSSPILTGNRLILTGSEPDRLVVLAIDRHTSRVDWRQEIEPGAAEAGSRLSHPASATPVTDGKRIVSYFASFGLVAHAPDGAELWRHPLPTPVTGHGASSSPVIAGDRVLLVCDQDQNSFLLALDAQTGAVEWRAARPEFRRGFSTPLPWPVDNPEVLIVAGSLRLVAYDLTHGRERWSVRGFPNEMVASPIPGDDLILVAGWTSGSGVSKMPDWDTLVTQGDADGDTMIRRDEAPAGPARQHFAYIDADRDGRLSRAEYTTIAEIFDRSENTAMAIRPGGSGDVTPSHVLWKQKRGLPYVPTPLYLGNRVYLLRNGGLVSCLDARSGTFLFQEERLGAMGDYYASPVAAKDRILAISQPGTAVVFRASDSLEVLARNPLGEEVLATPAIGSDTLYIRTRSALHAFREGTDQPQR